MKTKRPSDLIFTTPATIDLYLSSLIDNGDSWSWSLWSSGDADHVWISDGHHAERDVARRRVVRAAHLVDLVRLGHDDAVTLHDDGVCENSILKKIGKNENYFHCYYIIFLL